MAQLSIGTLVLGAVPRVVAVIDTIYPIERLERAVDQGADLFEMRIDRIPGGRELAIDYLRTVRSHIDSPIIGTVRENRETQDEPLNSYRAILPYVDAIDVEIGLACAAEISNQSPGKVKIVSHHDFTRMVPHDELSRIITDAGSLGADIVKIAAMAKSREEVVSLLQFASSRRESLVVIAMGTWGRISRIAAPLFGSLLTYASIGEVEVAPGQLSVEQTAALVRLFYK